MLTLDDVWVLMMGSWWRLSDATLARFRAETDGMPDWQVDSVRDELMADIYPDEWRTWHLGWNRLCELSGTPDLQTSHQTLTARNPGVLQADDVSEGQYEQAGLL